MTIRITHDAGVGEWAKGAVVVCDDRRATRLIQFGYAIEAEPVKETKRDGSPRRQRHPQ